MATFLYRLGALAAQRRLTFLALSLASIAGVLVLALSSPGSFESGSSIPGSPAQAALEKMDRHFPENGGITGDVVFVAPDGQQIMDGVVAEQIKATLQKIQTVDVVAQIGDPTQEVSEDGRVAVTTVTLNVPADEEVEPALQDAVRAAGADFSETGGRVLFGGDAFEEEHAPFGPTEVVGIGVALLVLLLTFGSIVAPEFPC